MGKKNGCNLQPCKNYFREGDHYLLMLSKQFTVPEALMSWKV